MRAVFVPTGPALNPVKPSDPDHEAVEAAAAQWLARCDRVLTPSEQDAYLEWLRAHPDHAAAVARLRQSWARLDQLGCWRPTHSATPNPDLLAPARRARWRPLGVLAMAAMVAIAGILIWNTRQVPAVESRVAKILPGPERLALEDGSLVELNAGAVVEVLMAPGERRVRLVRGEALFSVAKDPQRPFIVDTDGCEVRAVGTAFAVRQQADGLAVLVTEGEVRLVQATVGEAGRHSGATLVPRLTAGQEAIVSTAGPAGGFPGISVRDLGPAEVDAALAWRGIRLEFDDMPLRDVIMEFNRYNTRQLIIHNEATGAVLVGGSFRADNLDAFVRLLDSGFDVVAEPEGDGIVLRRR